MRMFSSDRDKRHQQWKDSPCKWKHMKYIAQGYDEMEIISDSFTPISCDIERLREAPLRKMPGQCISCLFPILRAYSTVLRLGAPGTDRQGIHIGVNMFSSVTT